MDELGRRYDLRLAAAYVRGQSRSPAELCHRWLDDLDEPALELFAPSQPEVESG